MNELLYPILIVLLGYIVLGITGFGSALIIVPLLSWKWPLAEVVALALLLDVPASLLHAGLNFKHLARAELRRLLPGLLAGALLGLWLSHALQPRWPLLALGLYVVAVGLGNLRRHRQERPVLANAWSWVAGMLIGVIEMLFGTAGPVIVAWLNRRVSDVQALRATTPLLIAISACTVLATMGFSGRLSHALLWQRWAVLIGIALIGVAIGQRLSRQIAAPTLKKVISALLVVSGIALACHALGSA